MQYSDSILKTPSSFIRNILKVTDAYDVISFAGGLPNPISFPIDELKQSVNDAIDANGAKVFQYSTTQGYLPLRQYIADKLNNKQSNLNYTAEDVLITTGSQQALELISKVLLNKGDGVVIEEPGYLGAIQAFTLREPSFYGVTLETEGLNVEQFKDALKQPNVKMVYTVPNFQNPTGLTYTKERREEVFEAVKDQDVIFIEDDPYGELRFTGEHLPYIAAGKMTNSVVLGSFSKTVTPGMRLGYILTKNHELLNHVETAKQATDLHTNIFAQYILHQYLTNNEYEAHVEKIIALYKTQADAMLAAMEKYFPPYVKYTKPEGGMFVWVTLPEGVNALDKFTEAMEKKVAFVPGNPFYTDKESVNTLRLNYTNATPETIEEGIKRLAEIL
ncbi:PLP-dependent aminotransferase family protein [Solibacillus sp. FSL W7-1472]|uniref:Transcriptional regulator containing a DNA-binding HTH domain and an aminotransferase domain n=2 Tax=Solibacillus TaxID=648800 RepID=F2F8B4_SOLSS|nr:MULTISPECIES: PLP-dependent aminotransferase family protein [Solibacillus]AMO84176.1 aspartate aminotransferase [Solibacillus silvestris]EKB46198.1 2-aminoadipate transaminase [Solibacillus isronensis B3W22]OBW59009.1 aspartate aminotransferase [Solibacillus silvestris]BAK17918.1 transcriptional regulator containing a DNA-binding HTH domain and an aminotransferase domain [Solibacillus silvestris StLB046]